jgi:hypothetical protein
VAVAAIMLSATVRAAAASGDIVPLNYPASTTTAGGAINGSGVVTGSYRVGNGSSAFRWSATGGYQPVSYPIYTEPSPRGPGEPPVIPSGVDAAISDNGIVAGLWGDDGYDIYSPFVNATGPPVAIPEPASYSLYEVRGVNDAGVVVGMMEQKMTSTGHAWQWSGSGAVQGLTALGGTTSSVGGIDNAGIMVGSASTGSATHATRWTAPDAVQDIHPQGVSSHANAINEAGLIVGSYALANGDSRAFRRDAGGNVQTLPMLPGNVDSTATEINEDGWIIGNMRDANFLTDFVLWTPDGMVRDLHLWVKQVNPVEGNRWLWFDSLDGISDDGRIVGWGYYDDGAGGLPAGYRSFVLDASTLPEPSAAFTLCATAIFTLARRRR